MEIASRSNLDGVVRRTVVAVGLAGALMCGLLLVVSLLYPTVLETWARKAIASEVQQRVDTHLDGLSNSAIGRAADRIIDKNKQEKAKAEEQMAKVLPSQTAVMIQVVIDRMLNPDCLCRKELESPGRLAELVKRAKKAENDFLTEKIGKLDEAKGKLTGLIESKYRDVAQSLLGEIRIFSGANGAVFLLLAITALMWKRSAWQLIAPAVVLVGAAALTAALYLFNQDWLQTILLNDYVGLWYFPYLGVALAFMFDLVFNRARVSRMLADAVGSVIGAPLSACG